MPTLYRPLFSHATLLPNLALVLAWFAPLPVTEAISSPPDGGYPNQNTAEGEGALFSLTIGGFDNQDTTAIGFDALFSSTNTFFKHGRWEWCPLR